MKEVQVTLPELALVAGTRAAAGAGLALILSDRLTADQRKAVGWSLFIMGALSTIPLAFEVLKSLSSSSEHSHQALAGSTQTMT